MYRPLFGFSVSSRPEATPAEMLKQLRRFGFTALEVNLGYLERHRSEVALLRRELEHLTCHLPQNGVYSVLSDDPEDDPRTLEALKGAFEVAHSVGCRTFTFHLKNPLGQRLWEYWDRSVEFARRLGEVAREHDAVVGLENCYPVVRTGEMARRFLGEVGHPSVGLTLDAGHFWSALCEDEYGHYRENPIMRTAEGARLLNRMCCEMARTAAGRIVDIHLHNLRPEDWLDHQPVGEGVMHYEEFFAILRETGYRGPVIVEIRARPDWLGLESSAAYLQQFR